MGWEFVPCRWGNYFQLKVRLGGANLWLTAEANEWHVETGDGTRVLWGEATDIEDARSQAVTAVLRMLSEAHDVLRQGTRMDPPGTLTINRPKAKRSGVKKRA